MLSHLSCLRLRLRTAPELQASGASNFAGNQVGDGLIMSQMTKLRLQEKQGTQSTQLGVGAAGMPGRGLLTKAACARLGP